MNEENDKKILSEENTADMVSEARERQKAAAEAARYTENQREALPKEEPGKEHPHEETEPDKEEKPPKLSFLKILKYLAAGVILFVFILLLYRISVQKKDYADLFLWTDRAIEAYEEKGSLTVWTQDMSSFTFTLERDENNMPTNTYTYTYYPYSGKKEEGEEPSEFDGCFMVSKPMYVEETQQLLVTFRVNRTAKDRVKDYYSLETAPRGDVFFFILSDGENEYADYEYITFEKDNYYYYRLVFNDVPYNYLKSYTGVTEADIISLSLSVYYSGLYHLDSPLDTITVANNMIEGDAYKIEKALPAERDAALKKGPDFLSEEDTENSANEED